MISGRCFMYLYDLDETTALIGEREKHPKKKDGLNQRKQVFTNHRLGRRLLQSMKELCKDTLGKMRT